MTDPNMYIFPSNNFVDLTIYQFGHQDCPPFHANGPLVFNHFLFHYVHKDKGVFYAEDEQNRTIRYDVEAGQGFYINLVLIYIENHYQDNIRVEDIAASCNLDRSHIGKIFKLSLGISLRDYLIRYRINKACELMKGTSCSIGEIGGMVGYPNMFNFSRAFKAVMGMSPRRWRDEKGLYRIFRFVTAPFRRGMARPARSIDIM